MNTAQFRQPGERQLQRIVLLDGPSGQQTPQGTRLSSLALELK